MIGCCIPGIKTFGKKNSREIKSEMRCDIYTSARNRKLLIIPFLMYLCRTDLSTVLTKDKRAAVEKGNWRLLIA